jgi:hypothetical protein
MTELAHLQKGKVYRLQSRNLSCGVWDGEKGFIGIRRKFGSCFLEREIHWDLDENHGTAKAMDELGAIPESIPLDISIGTVCEQCRKPMSYVQNRELDGKPNQGEWLHDDGSPRCVISTGGVKSRVAGPVMISNEALFAELEKYESEAV